MMNIARSCLLVTLLTVCSVPAGAFADTVKSAAAGPVLINEIMAINSKTVKDPQGQYDDWIELYNSGNSLIDIGGMYLTDDPNEPRKWQLPADDPLSTYIGPKGFLVIWADGDTSAVDGLHANFKLSGDGESVSLFASDGTTLVDSVVFGPQMSDISFGRYPDGADSWHYFGTPTPRAANSRAYDGVITENVEFSQQRGFYDASFVLRLAAKTSDAVIYYTLDGSDPVSSTGQGTGLLYSGAIPISTTTCVRAAVTKTGYLPSRIASSTYIFLADVIRQPAAPSGFPTTWGSRPADYAMDQAVVQNAAYRNEIKDDLKAIPTVSIVLPTPDLFDSKTGIYANSSASGDQWERAASMEWIDPCTGDQFGVNAGLRIAGGYYARASGTNRKFGLQFFFRNEYGMKRLEFPMFKDTELATFSRLGLREVWNYSWIGDGGQSSTYGSDYLRALFTNDTVRDMDRLIAHGRPVHVYLNGLYWGMYFLTERIDDDFAADNLGGSKDDYDVLEAPSGSAASSVMKVLTGDKTTMPPQWNTLYAKANAGVSTTQAYQDIQQYVDVGEMIDYMLMIYYVGSRDGPTYLGTDYYPRNFYALRSRVPAGPFLFLPWDTEWCLESPTENRLSITGVYNPSLLMNLFAANAGFKMTLADYVHKRFHNGGALTRDSVVQRYGALANEIHGAIVGESARWGDLKRPGNAYTRVDWQTEVDRLNNTYFSGRTDTVLQQLKSRGWYPSIDAPAFQIDGKAQLGGVTSPGASLSMTNPNATGTIWYTLDGSDPRVAGSGASSADVTLVAESASKKAFVPTAAISSAWQGGAAFDDANWISGSGGVGYERSTGYESYFKIDVGNQMYQKYTTCYIRIPFTVAAADVNQLSSLTLNMRCDDGFIAYINGVEVARKNFTGAPTWNSKASALTDDTDAIVLTPWPISQSVTSLRAGTNILAIQGLNESTTSSDFLISAELKAVKGVGTSGGASQMAIKYTSPITLSVSTLVKACVLNGSTWSALNEAIYAVGPVASGLRVSEIMYHPLNSGNPNDPNTEFVELTNVGSAQINLNFVQFTKGVTFTFGNLDLAPKAYTLVVKDLAAFKAKYGNTLPIAGQYDGSLSNAGERIQLVDAAGQVIEDFTYADGWYKMTDGQGFSLTAANAAVVDPNGFNDASFWRPSAHIGGSPGYDDTGLVPALGAAVINEIMANPKSGESDWIELYNTTDQPIHIGEWFLSDDGDNLMKYEIAAGTSIPAKGYIVFTAGLNFGNGADPGCRVPFGFSKDGETAYLTSGSGGVLTGYTQQEHFDATETGVSIGRYNKSAGGYNFVELTSPTPGAVNAAPKVGPIVISEIMYNPIATPDSEYVELLNISDAPVPLYDPITRQPWRLTAGDPNNPTMEFLFPTDSPITLEPGQRMILTKNLQAFIQQFGAAPTGVPIVEWGFGWLSNGGDKVQISRPVDVTHWIRVDRVVYSDGSHPDFGVSADPWPKAADGQGQSLVRIDPTAYGNDPANWHAATPTPGKN